MADAPRLIERAFPLKQASLDSVHEKNVRHGHISTLHIWPARRPLAACRAALIATLLPDPGTPEERQKLCERIGGRVVQKTEKKKMPDGRLAERIKEETEGGILHWLGSEPSSGGRKKKETFRRRVEHCEQELEWFRREIRRAYGGRAPRVVDPFAGGGAIPLEAMRLGCETMAVDINPVAWFILKCTLEYPHKLAGKTRPLPDFVLKEEQFLSAFYMAHPELAGSAKPAKRQVQDRQNHLFLSTGSDTGRAPEADLAWHVRAWGRYVLDRVRRDLAKLYPTYADFEPLKLDKAYEKHPMRLVPLKDDGTADISSLNGEFTDEYLAGKGNPRWVIKPTVAYLWARTVTCKNCRATVPLLKTCWLSKKPGKRVLVVPTAGANGNITFTLRRNEPVVGGNAAQRREHDRRVGIGTMSKSGARCLHCPAIQTHEDIQAAALSNQWSSVMTAVVVDGLNGKEFREATEEERLASKLAPPQGVEPLRGTISSVRPSPNARGLSGLTRYGIDDFGKVFNNRQFAALHAFSDAVIKARQAIDAEYDRDMANAVSSYLAASVDRLSDRNSTLCHWNKDYEKITGTFQRYALRVNWDYAEVNPFSPTTGNYSDAVEWIARFLDHALRVPVATSSVRVAHGSATSLALEDKSVDVVLTDPPYYDAIPYSDLSDYYYVWLRRSLRHVYPEQFSSEITKKDDDLIQHAALGNGDNRAAKQRYENGMAAAFKEAHRCLTDDGRFVVVFAHKHPDAWETLVSAIIRAGFVVDGSWPIRTEMPHKAAAGARLASSVWLVCRKRPEAARPGWDNNTLEEMRRNIRESLRGFWDAGIRGPDFVWAATGPALEAYSKYPVVKKANDPGKTMEVSEFLSHVRRMVVDFVVGQVLTGDGAGADLAAADRMDAPTAYYLLHRHDFGLEEAPSGGCILYATACGLSDHDLETTWDVLVRIGGGGSEDEEQENDEIDPDAEEDPDEASDSGTKVKLKTWAQRKHKGMGYEAPGGQQVPLIDRVHRLMHLWRAGDVLKVDEYLDDYGLRRQELFRRLLQSLIELSPASSDERTLLESLSNHIQAKGAKPEDRQAALAFGEEH
ncbi:MAG: DUF1156 domain-containing protein [Bryobacteraceae bacterium]